MSTLGEELFNQLQDAEVLRSLTGQSEDVHFDCKAWPASDGDAQRTLAKAGCGLSDSEGGVVLIGMKAHAGRIEKFWNHRLPRRGLASLERREKFRHRRTAGTGG